jgi:hypothetical protein
MSSAKAVTDCVLLHGEKKAMMLAMSLEAKLSAGFSKQAAAPLAAFSARWIADGQ